MTMVVYGLAQIQMLMSLPEMGVQLMILPTISFSTVNAIPYWTLVFQVFPAVPDLVSLSCGSFSILCPSDLGKAQDVPSIAF